MRQNILLGFLACSLIMNAFLAGYIVSGETRHKRHMPNGHLNRMEAAAQDLDPKYQEQVLKLITDNQPRLDKEIQDMGQSFQEIHSILTAEKFDAKKLKDLHTKLAKHDEAMKDAVVTLFTKISETLPDRERIEFFNEMDPGPPNGRFGGPHGPDGPGGEDHGFDGPPPSDEPFDEK